jgi:succinate dehydrogenase / fumarate reductase iron-sulfur subunit
VKDLVADRSAFDRIIAAGGFISGADRARADGNAIPIPKEKLGPRHGRGRVHRLRRVRRGVPQRVGDALHVRQGRRTSRCCRRASPSAAPRARMVAQMDAEGFGTCTNHGECEAVCPKAIRMEFIARMNADFVKANMMAGRRSPDFRSAGAG